jgi:hypothetical protein
VSVDAELVADRLPSYVTRFVGREEEIAELETMVKPGGAGQYLRGGRTRQDPAGDRASETVVS